MAKVGLSDFYYATLTSDTVAAVAYATPVKVPGIVSADIKVASDIATLFADDGPYEVSNALGEITVELELADLPLEVAAALLGHSVTAGVMTSKADDVSPYVAIGFIGKGSNSQKLPVWLLKGQFSEPDDTYKTKEDKVSFQTSKITGKFVARVYDNKYKMKADNKATGFVETTLTNWFEAATINAGA